jgi:hypothetical protein
MARPKLSKTAAVFKKPNDAFRAIVDRHAPGRELPVEQVVSAAEAEFPYFSDYIDTLCR